MKTSEVLEKAADILERYGWCQGQSMNEHGEFCSRGAIVYALPLGNYEYQTEIEALSCLAQAITQTDRLISTCNLVPIWNDAPERTKQEVLDAFRKAAKIARLNEEGIIDEAI